MQLLSFDEVRCVDLLTFEKNDIPVPEMDGRPVAKCD